MKLAGLFTTKQRGDDAERLAEDFLGKQGLKLVERNYRCRFGEVDLVMQHGATLVFVEVRLRKHGGRHGGNDFGGAAASITAGKQRRLIAAAQHYLAGRKELPPCRFDAVLLNQLSEEGIEWIQDAFAA
jgi:putative endonuclease